MCDSVFVIGPQGSYHFEAPSQWKFHGLPAGILKEINARNVASTYCVALGAGDSYWFAYKNRSDGLDYLGTSGLPQSLHDWLNQVGRDGYLVRVPSKLVVSIGPDNNSYYANDEKRFLRSNLPTHLEQHVADLARPGADWRNIPRILSLGVNGNYIMVSKGQGALWNLPDYDELRQTIERLRQEKSFSFSWVQNIYLNPHAAQCAVIQGQSGKTFGFNLPGHAEADFQSIASALEADTRALTRQKAAEEQLAIQALQNQMQIQSSFTQNMMALNTAFSINMMNSF